MREEGAVPYGEHMAPRSAYLDRLAEIPVFRRCSRRELVLVSQLVDEIVLPVGTTLPSNSRDLAIALAPTRVLVVERRALPALLELVPGLMDAPPRAGTRQPRLRLVPACFLSSA
jgi:hypothetical protein